MLRSILELSGVDESLNLVLQDEDFYEVRTCLEIDYES